MLLSATGLHKEYASDAAPVTVLRGAELHVDAGEVVLIVGASGSGKSTLLHVLGGLDAPDAGCVAIDDTDVYAQSAAARASLRGARLGFIFQFYHLLPELTALENVMLPLMIAQRSATAAREAATDALARVDLRERATHYPHQLSGGEQQRVAIARAVVTQPALLLADEPTGNLDETHAREVMTMLREIQRRDRMALVLVTHNPALRQDGDRCVRLHDGVLQAAA